jgi:hypothetical protein
MMQLTLVGDNCFYLKELVESEVMSALIADGRIPDLECEQTNTVCCKAPLQLTMAIALWPEVLVLHLKRYRFVGENGPSMFRGLDAPVWFGKTLQVHDSPVYSLRAMVLHKGTKDYACCRAEDCGWFEFNDAGRPRALSEADLFPAQVSLRHRHVYMLFYEKTYDEHQPSWPRRADLDCSGFTMGN